MSLQEIIYKGTLVSTGAPQWVSIPAGFDQFRLRNRTTHAAGAGITDAYWFANDPAGWATIDTVAGGTITTTVIAAGGFTYADSSTTALGPAIAVTAVTAASPAVASTATTPVVGDIVRIYGTTGMLQIAGMDFTVTAVNPGVSMSFGYLAAVGFAAAATAGTYRRVPFDAASYPRRRYITAITAANPCVVTMSVTHGYVVGQKVTIYNPPTTGGVYRFGMPEIHGLTGTITAITTGATNTITLDFSSVGFTAFAFPTSANAALGITFPQVVPAGETGNMVTGAFSDPGMRGIYIGATIQGTAADIWDFWAIRSEV